MKKKALFYLLLEQRVLVVENLFLLQIEVMSHFSKSELFQHLFSLKKVEDYKAHKQKFTMSLVRKKIV